MPGLRRLHTSMRRAGILRAKFRVQHNQLTFEGLFLTDAAPYEFALACLAHNVVILLAVRPGYQITPYLGDSYRPLLEALRTDGLSGRAFKLDEFLRQLDGALPHAVSAANQARPADIGRIYRNVDEADKLYLCGWRDNTRTGEHVSAANLAKTRKLLGQKAYEFCERNNVSGCWTDDPKREIKPSLPPAHRP